MVSKKKKTDDIYQDVSQDIETRFDTSNYELDKPLTKRKNKKVIGLINDELGEQIMTEFVGLRAKTYIYLIHDCSEDEKSKSTKKFVIKIKLTFQDYKTV